MTDLTLDEALKKIAALEEANAKLQYRVNHLVRCAKENTKDTTATRPACNAFNSKPLVLSKDSAFSNRLSLRTLLESKFGGVAFAGQTVTVGGWVHNIRCNKKLGFIELNDGSTALSLQLVGDAKLKDWPVLSSLTRGSAALFTGVIVKSPKPAQPIEMQVATVELLGACDAETYGLTKPFHSFDHLRTIAHMRARTPPLASVLRIRNALAFATHTFYQEQGFVYFHAPIITASDCEGAGEMFQVSTLLDSEHGSEKASLKKQTYKGDFFERPAFLTVSGQLSAETAACALTKVYTFGPTFRAENSNTSRHLAEFWMIEPEVSFCDVNGAMDLAEEYVRHSIGYVLRECSNDLKTLESMSQTFENWKTVDGFVDSLKKLQTTAFGRLTYTDAITKLEEAVAGGHHFDNSVEWGMDLPTEMERYLAEVVYKGPVFVYNYPKDIKAFYMRMNDDGKTVAAFDLLVPGVGELIGGSQREEREDALLKRLDELKLDKEAYWWYLDLRKFGTVPHSGFGLGFERLVMLSTGMRNIRDVIPYPRYPGAAEF